MAQTPGNPFQRQLRVFVSSTFKDMKAERDYLVKFTFPQLRALCESRGVVWGDVDLRWGVTDEQKAEGKVLPICLEEIERCRPFFIGILGERYGWIPEQIPQELIEQEPWIEPRQERSVTELEIVHGFLRLPQMQGHAYFYFRDPAYLERLPAGSDRADFESENASAHHKLVTLKQKLRLAREQKRLRLRESYRDPMELGQWILKDFTRLIDRLFPEGKLPGWLEREALEAAAFASSRTGVYIGRQEYFERLNAHVTGDEPALVVLGESGSGKSALLANWSEQYRAAHPGDLVLTHFLGASQQSASWTTILRRIMGELKESLDLADEVPQKPDDLCKGFPNWLSIAEAKLNQDAGSSPGGWLRKLAGRKTPPPSKPLCRPTAPSRRIILVLDGLDQLEDRDGAPDLVWLPPVLPDRVRWIASTLPGRSLNAIRRQKWAELQLAPLDLDERRRLVVEVLARHAKALSRPRLERLASDPACATPLFLRLLLDELRLFGEHARLDERIGYYLQARTPRELYGKVIARWRQDYDGQHGIVDQTLSLLWAARRGLSESEILALLGSASLPMPRAEWSPLFLAMEPALVNRSGLLSFAHDYLRTAVQEICLPEVNLQREAHLRLAGYFEGQPAGLRRTDGSGWQLCQAQEWTRLVELLSQPDSLRYVSDESKFDTYSFWVEIESNSPFKLASTYERLIQTPELLDVEGRSNLYTLLRNTGHIKEAMRVFQALDNPGKRDLNLMAQQAFALHLVGQSQDGLTLLKEMDKICRQIGDRKQLAISLGTQASILTPLGKHEMAMQLHQQEESLYRELDFQAGISTSLANQALLWMGIGEYDKALILVQEAERIERQRGDLYGLQSCLGIKGQILISRGELDEAIQMYQEQERICRQTGQDDGLADSLAHRAAALVSQNRLEEASTLIAEAEGLWRALDRQAGLQHLLVLKATIALSNGEPDEAMRLCLQQEQICRTFNLPRGLEIGLGIQAEVFESIGNNSGALSRYAEAASLARQTTSPDLIVWLDRQGTLLFNQGNLDEAMDFFKEVTALATNSNHIQALAKSAGYQGLISNQRRFLDEALQHFEDAAGYSRQTHDLSSLQAWLGNQGIALKSLRRFPEAINKLIEQEMICLEINDTLALRTAYREHIETLLLWGKLVEAINILEKAETLDRKTGDAENLNKTLSSKGAAFKQLSRYGEAQAIYQELAELSRKAGDTDLLQKSLGVQVEIALAQGRIESALTLVTEWEQLCRANHLLQGLSAALAAQADVFRLQGDQPQARARYEEALKISRAGSELNGMQSQLGAIGWSHYMSGEIDEAAVCFDEQEQLARKSGNQVYLESSLGGQGAVARARGKQDEALRLFEQQEVICRESGHLRDLQASLNNQGLIYWDRGNYARALELFDDVERACRATGNQEVLWHALYNQAEILFRHLGERKTARLKVDEAVAILRRTGIEPDWLQRCQELQREVCA